MPADDGIEPRERSRSGAARDWNTERPERRRFPEVRIGDEQRLATAPPDSALRKERELLSSYPDNGLVHPAAFSRESCIRRMRSLSDSDDTLSRLRSTTSGKPSGVVRFGSVTTILDAESLTNV